MITHRGKANVISFQLLLDSGCSSRIVIRIIITKLKTQQDSVMQCYTQESKITTNMKVKYIIPTGIYHGKTFDVELSCV